MIFPSRWPRAVVLALLPMLAALAGGYVDERSHLGFSLWRSACRAADLTLSSLLTFTLQLLPTAVIGALVGGVLVQLAGFGLRHRACAPEAALAAHGGCVLGMAAGVFLCTLNAPVPLLLGVETLLTAGCAAGLFHLQARRLAFLTAWKLA